MNIFGLVTRRKKLAATMGMSVNAEPMPAAINDFDNHDLDGTWCGWSLRDAATSRLTSGVIVQRAEQCLVAEGVRAGHQTPAALEDRNALTSDRAQRTVDPGFRRDDSWSGARPVALSAVSKPP